MSTSTTTSSRLLPWDEKMFLFTLMALWIVPSTISLALAFIPVPVERFHLTSCNIYRTFPPNGSEALLSPLTTRHPEIFRCDPVNGLSLDFDLVEQIANTTVALETASTVQNFGKHLEKDQRGLTVAVWFTPTADNPERIQPILAFGGSNSSRAKGPEVLTRCPGFDFLISQFETMLYLQYTSSESLASGYRCHHVQASRSILKPAVLTHVAVVFDASETMLYLNGQAVILGIPNHFQNMLRNWNFSTSRLQLFSAPKAIFELFHGSIHQVDLFDQALGVDSMALLYGEGLLPVAPSVVSVSARIDEIHWMYQQSSTTNSSLSLQIGSRNATASVFQLEVELLSLPQHGSLRYNVTQVIDSTSRRFPVENSTNVITLHYQPAESEYFNVPLVNMYGRNIPFTPESFDFRIRAYDFKRKLIAISPTTTQLIQVVHVNHPGILTGPNQALLNSLNPVEAIVPTPIDFTDSLDFDTEYVRVDLWAEHGVLSLQVDGLRLAEFDTCRDRMDFGGQWQCVGDGKRNSNMTFIAIPSDVRAILRYLLYHRLPPGLADKIHVQVWDGTGEEMCLSPSEQLVRLQSFLTENSTFFSQSVQNRCYYHHITVEVPGYNSSDIDPLEPKDEARFSGFLGFLSIADLLFWGLVCFVIVFCAISCRQLPRCSARGRAVDVGNDDEHDIAIPTLTDLQHNPFSVPNDK
jgi:Concanavalin A-like lectin/glucanases superfamily